MPDKSEEQKIQCPYCRSTDTIKRGIAKREGKGSIQVYGCKECKRRFTLGDDETAKLPVQRAVDTYLLKIKELESANKTLLDNNVKLAAENTRLSAMTDIQHTRILTLDKEKTECKQKCEVVISEKDRKIRTLEEYKAGCKTTFERLRGGSWMVGVKQNDDGTIAITHTVKTA